MSLSAPLSPLLWQQPLPQGQAQPGSVPGAAPCGCRGQPVPAQRMPSCANHPEASSGCPSLWRQARAAAPRLAAGPCRTHRQGTGRWATSWQLPSLTKCSAAYGSSREGLSLASSRQQPRTASGDCPSCTLTAGTPSPMAPPAQPWGAAVPRALAAPPAPLPLLAQCLKAGPSLG